MCKSLSLVANPFALRGQVCRWRLMRNRRATLASIIAPWFREPISITKSPPVAAKKASPSATAGWGVWCGRRRRRCTSKSIATMCFGENSYTTSFPKQDSDYASGCGYVDINVVDAGPDVFAGPTFHQHLSLYDGMMTARGNGIVCAGICFAAARRDRGRDR